MKPYRFKPGAARSFLSRPPNPLGMQPAVSTPLPACTSGSLIAVRLESVSNAKSLPHLPHGESVHCPLLTVIASVQYLLVVDVTISHWHAQEWPSDRTNVINDYGSWFPDWASTSSSSLHVASTTVHLEGLTWPWRQHTRYCRARR